MKSCKWCGRPESEMRVSKGQGMRKGEVMDLCDECKGIEPD